MRWPLTTSCGLLNVVVLVLMYILKFKKNWNYRSLQSSYCKVILEEIFKKRKKYIYTTFFKKCFLGKQHCSYDGAVAVAISTKGKTDAQDVVACQEALCQYHAWSTSAVWSSILAKLSHLGNAGSWLLDSSGVNLRNTFGIGHRHGGVASSNNISLYTYPPNTYPPTYLHPTYILYSTIPLALHYTLPISLRSCVHIYIYIYMCVYTYIHTCSCL